MWEIIHLWHFHFHFHFNFHFHFLLPTYYMIQMWGSFTSDTFTFTFIFTFTFSCQRDIWSKCERSSTTDNHSPTTNYHDRLQQEKSGQRSCCYYWAIAFEIAFSAKFKRDLRKFNLDVSIYMIYIENRVHFFLEISFLTFDNWFDCFVKTKLD